MKRLLVLALALVFVGALAVPAAGEVTVSGNIRMVTGWLNQSEEVSATGDARTTSIWETALVGSFFQIKYANEDVSALLDVALPYPAGAQSSSILRQGFGTWTFAEGSELLFGQAFCVFAPACAVGQILKNDTVCTGYGAIWQDWRPQLRYTRTMDFGSIRVAAVAPNTDTYEGPLSFLTGAATEGTNAIIPRIEAAADITVAEGVTLTPSFVFNTFQVENFNGVAGDDNNYSTYAGALSVAWSLAAVQITAEAHYGQNMFIFSGPDHTPTLEADGSIDENTTGYGGFIELQIPFEPMTLYVGGGMDVASNDQKGTEDTDQAYSFFASIGYKPTAGFEIRPEVAYFDDAEDYNGNDEGSETYFGISWQVSF